MNLGPGIIMDIIVVVIVLLSTIWGARRGFVLTVISFMQWFVCLICGFVFCTWMKGFLIDNTTIDDSINKYLLEQMGGSISDNGTYQVLPDLFSKSVSEATDQFVYGASASLTSVLLTVISFLIIVFGIKIVGFSMARIFSRKYHDGAVGFVDGFLGFVFGLIRGALLVFLFFALLVPVLGLVMPESAETIVKAMETSNIAGYLYNYNFLLIIVRDFIK